MTYTWFGSAEGFWEGQSALRGPCGAGRWGGGRGPVSEKAATPGVTIGPKWTHRFQDEVSGHDLDDLFIHEVLEVWRNHDFTACLSGIGQILIWDDMGGSMGIDG